jgi:hypothetical protein
MSGFCGKDFVAADVRAGGRLVRDRSSGIGVIAVSVLVDNELPEPTGRVACSEVSEVEGQDREMVAFSDCHDRTVGIAEVQVGERGVELDRASTVCG